MIQRRANGHDVFIMFIDFMSGEEGEGRRTTNFQPNVDSVIGNRLEC